MNGGGWINVGSTGNITPDQNGGTMTGAAALIRAQQRRGTSIDHRHRLNLDCTYRRSYGRAPRTWVYHEPDIPHRQRRATVNVTHKINLDTASTLTLQGGTLSAAEIGLNGLQFNGTFQWTSGTLHVGVFRKSLTNQGGGRSTPGPTPAGRTDIDGNHPHSSSFCGTRRRATCRWSIEMCH